MTNKYTARLILTAMALSLLPQLALADSGQWQQLKNEADTAYSANNYGVAERSYTEALKLAEKFGSGDVRLANTLQALVALYSTRAQFAKAEPLFERELRAREKALGPEHPDVIATVGRLAQFYINNGATAKSDRLTNMLLMFAERKVKDQHVVKEEFARLSKFYDKSKNYAPEQAALRKLEESTQKTTANQDLELATTLDSLGRLYQGKNKLDVAERMFKNSLAFRQKTLASNHLALAYSFENLANLYLLEGKQELAQSYFKKALDVTEKTLLPGRPEFYCRLDALAQTHNKMGQSAEAESLYRRALTLIDKTSPNSYDAGRAAYALGSLYTKQGRYGEAEPLMKRALKGAEGANGPEHAAVAPILDNYAEVLQKLNKGGEAARLRARAKSIRGVSVVQTGSDF